MHLPPCHSRRDVDAAKELYFCAHPRLHVRNQLVTPPICHSCTLWQKPPPAEFRVMPRGPLVRDEPCRHLGAVIELRDCAGCRGSVKIKVFACRHPAHTETTDSQCRECPDYELLGRGSNGSVTPRSDVDSVEVNSTSAVALAVPRPAPIRLPLQET
jgi:hypothetical protein